MLTNIEQQELITAVGLLLSISIDNKGEPSARDLPYLKEMESKLRIMIERIERG